LRLRRQRACSTARASVQISSATLLARRRSLSRDAPAHVENKMRDMTSATLSNTAFFFAH